MCGSAQTNFSDRFCVVEVDSDDPQRAHPRSMFSANPRSSAFRFGSDNSSNFFIHQWKSVLTKSNVSPNSFVELEYKWKFMEPSSLFTLMGDERQGLECRINLGIPHLALMVFDKQDGMSFPETTKCDLVWATEKQCVCALVVGHDNTMDSR